MQSPPEPGSAREARALALRIAPGVFLAGVGGGMAFPILPLVGLKAGLPLPFIGLILAANRIGRVAVSPLVGRAIDRFGPKRLLVLGLALNVVVFGCYWAGVVTGRPGGLFLIGRLLHGPGSACVFIGGQMLALHAGGERYRGLSSGIVRSAQSAGMPAGLVLGGLLAGWLGPAAAFAVAALAPAAAVLVAETGIPDLRAVSRQLPSLRATLGLLADPSIAALGWVSFASAFSAQGVVLTTLVLLVRDRHIALGSLSAQTSSGLFMGIVVVCMVLASPAAGRLSDRPGWRALLATGGLAAMIPGLLLIGLAHAPWSLGFGLSFVGLGMGALAAPRLALIGDLAGPAWRGTALGTLQLCGDIGGSLGPVVGATLLGAGGLAPFAGSAALVALALPAGLFLRGAELRARAAAG